jgi:hypothetical protein
MQLQTAPPVKILRAHPMFRTDSIITSAPLLSQTPLLFFPINNMLLSFVSCTHNSVKRLDLHSLQSQRTGKQNEESVIILEALGSIVNQETYCSA